MTATRAIALAGLLTLPTACPSAAPAGTSSGASGTTTGGIGTSTGGGGTCIGALCQTNIDCCQGYTCDNIYHGGCCANVGSPCIDDSDCCNIRCDEETEICVAATTGGVGTGGTSGAPTTGTTSGSSTSSTSGSTSGGTSVGQASTSSGTTSGSTSAGGTSGSTGGGPTANFTWTFGVGQSCELAQVGWVAVELSDAGSASIRPCRSPSGEEGAAVPFPEGLSILSYSLTGYDPFTGVAIAEGSGSQPAPLTGNASVSATLELSDGGPSAIRLLWTFGGQSCAVAGVSSVTIALQDPNDPTLDVNRTEPCEDGGVQGLTLSGYGPGEFPVSLSAEGDAGLFQATGTAVANGVTAAQVHADLAITSGASAAGDVGVAFNFGGLGCAAAGLDAVSLQLVTPSGSALAPSVSLACADAGTSTLFTSVPAPATGVLWLEGSSRGAVQSLAEAQLVVVPGVTASYTVTAQPAP